MRKANKSYVIETINAVGNRDSALARFLRLYGTRLRIASLWARASPHGSLVEKCFGVLTP